MPPRSAYEDTPAHVTQSCRKDTEQQRDRSAPSDEWGKVPGLLKQCDGLLIATVHALRLG
jgi:hypothetical protein